jgi:hypothetical protein
MYNTLIRHYLHIEPPADSEQWKMRVEEALWIEERLQKL